MINKTIWLGLFIGLSLPVFSLSIQSEVMNPNSSPIIETNVGINSKFKLFMIPCFLGIEYTKFNQYGTVHVPINSKFISKQEQWSIPLGFYTGISPIPKLFIGGIIGIRLFSNLPLSETTIEEQQSIANGSVVSNYKESLDVQPFYKIELSYQFYDRWHATVSKAWNKIKSKTSFTYLDNYKVEKINEFNYDPISVAISYHF